MNPEALQSLIQAALPEESTVMVNSDDDVHFEAIVVSPAFENLSKVKQHKLVYAALGDHFQQGTVHALGLKTYTPATWQTLSAKHHG